MEFNLELASCTKTNNET